MRTLGGRKTAKQWARLAMKFGLLLTDSRAWADVNEHLSERVDGVGNALKEKYDQAADRLHKARRALDGDTRWVAPAVSFLGGIALGTGLGLLFAPVSGEEARTTLRDKAAGLRNKVSDVAGRYYQTRVPGEANLTDGD